MEYASSPVAHAGVHTLTVRAVPVAATSGLSTSLRRIYQASLSRKNSVTWMGMPRTSASSSTGSSSRSRA